MSRTNRYHSMSIIQLPAYQPYGGMPPEIPAPWLPGLAIEPKNWERNH